MLEFTEDQISGLQTRELTRLARWVAPMPYRNFMIAGAVFGTLLATAVFVRRTSGTRDLPETVTASTVAAGLGLYLFAFVGPLLAYWLKCLLDRSHAFGDAGAKILRWLKHPVTSRLFRKEQAIQLTRRWSREGRRNGVDVAWREQRVMDLLGGHLTETAIDEIHDLIRGSLLRAASGDIDPRAYEVGGRWTARGSLRLAAEVTASIVLVAPALYWLGSILTAWLRGEA
ncbi:hypothetical protein [Myceligenerans cantabricum]